MEAWIKGLERLGKIGREGMGGTMDKRLGKEGSQVK